MVSDRKILDVYIDEMSFCIYIFENSYVCKVRGVNYF